MAQYTFRDHNGLTPNHSGGVDTNVWALVEKAAKDCPYNKMASAPDGFDLIAVKGKVVPVHARTGIQFKAGFLFSEVTGSQKWEGKATSGGYRLDLQGIENGYANWAIQTNGSNSKTVATCLMKVDKCFSQSQLAHGLKQSASRNKLCSLDM